MDVGCYQVEVQNWGWERRERRRRKKQELFKFFRNGTSHFWNPPKNANPWAVAKMASPRYFTSQVHFRILRLFVALVWGRCTCLLDADNFFCTFFCVVAAFFASFWGCDFCCCGFRVTALLLLCFFYVLLWIFGARGVSTWMCTFFLTLFCFFYSFFCPFNFCLCALCLFVRLFVCCFCLFIISVVYPLVCFCIWFSVDFVLLFLVCAYTHNHRHSYTHTHRSCGWWSLCRFFARFLAPFSRSSHSFGCSLRLLAPFSHSLALLLSLVHLLLPFAHYVARPFVRSVFLLVRLLALFSRSVFSLRLIARLLTPLARSFARNPTLSPIP